MKEKFESSNFRAVSLEVIEKANMIIQIYKDQNLDLTLRQLYYQFVARDIFPKSWFDEKANSFNTLKNYNNLGRLISKGRKAGLIDWFAIDDPERPIYYNSHWDSPKNILEAAVNSFRIDLWETQEAHIEVLIEKRALISVIRSICIRYDVRYTTTRGFSSDTHMYQMAKRIENAYFEKDKEIHIIHLADHDPSGIEMTNDIENRLYSYSNNAEVKIHRVALNMSQIQQFNPPPNFAKETDSRFASYQEKFGETCWELDAIEPTELQMIIEQQIAQYIDFDAWQDRNELQERWRNELSGFAKKYD